MKHLLQNRHARGSALVFSLLVLSIFLSVALGSAGIVITGKNSSRATEKSALAFQIADGAAESVLKRIYKNNDNTLSALAGNLNSDADTGGSAPECISNVIQGTLPLSSSGQYEVTLYEGNTAMPCRGTGYNTYDEWRNKVTRILAVGSYSGSTRAISVDVKPAPCRGVTTVDDADNNTYDTIEIGTQCWMQQNMNVGTMRNSSTPQTNDGTIEKYCYNNQVNNCNNNHPNYPDGGLYTWDEAMQYSTTEGAQGICPTGWHVPTDNEWYVLENFLKDAGQICTDSRTGLIECISAGSKLSGASFFGNYSGRYGTATGFDNRGNFGVYWSSTQPNGTEAWARGIINSSAGVMRDKSATTFSYSIRCLKD